MKLAAQKRPLLTLLPGSRNQEVKNVLPILLDTAAIVKQSVPNCRIVVASFNEKQKAMADSMLAEHQAEAEIETMVGRTPELMKAATVCVACSGSVSMELLYYRKADDHRF